MTTKRIVQALLMTLLCMVVVPTAGCSKDDEGFGPVNGALIIGKWEGVSSTGWEKEYGEIVDKWNDDKEYCEFEFIEFKADATGSWKESDSSYTHNFGWYINDDYELVIGERVVGDGTGDVYKIKTLTKDKMILVSSDDDPDDGWYFEDTYKRIN